LFREEGKEKWKKVRMSVEKVLDRRKLINTSLVVMQTRKSRASLIPMQQRRHLAGAYVARMKSVVGIM